MTAYQPTLWSRSPGIFGGVSAGIANRLNLNPWLVRSLWLVAVCAFGTGFLLYAALWIVMPKSTELHRANQPKVLGVCPRLAARFGIETSLVRLGLLASLLLSFGTTALVYLLLHFVMDHEPQRRLPAPR